MRNADSEGRGGVRTESCAVRDNALKLPDGASPSLYFLARRPHSVHTAPCRGANRTCAAYAPSLNPTCWTPLCVLGCAAAPICALYAATPSPVRLRLSLYAYVNPSPGTAARASPHHRVQPPAARLPRPSHYSLRTHAERRARPGTHPINVRARPRLHRGFQHQRSSQRQQQSHEGTRANIRGPPHRLQRFSIPTSPLSARAKPPHGLARPR